MWFNRTQIVYKIKDRLEYRGLLGSWLINREKVIYNQRKRKNFWRNFKNKNKLLKFKYRMKVEIFKKI
jgi:hypothetical protein